MRLLENLSHQLDLSIKIYVARTPGSPVTFEWLRSSARLRVCLYLVADLLVHYAKGSPTRELAHRENMMLQQLIQYLSEALQREELQEVTLYLTKQIARRHGMTSLTDLYNQGHRFVLPTRFHSDEVRSHFPCAHNSTIGKSINEIIGTHSTYCIYWMSRKY